MEYEDEKAGFTWNQNESLAELVKPERIEVIKWRVFAEKYF